MRFVPSAMMTVSSESVSQRAAIRRLVPQGGRSGSFRRAKVPSPPPARDYAIERTFRVRRQVLVRASVQGIDRVGTSSAFSVANRSGRARPRAVANGSIALPPATVRRADWSRRISRSPHRAPTGSSSTICTRLLSPGAISRPSSTATRPVTLVAARCRWMGAQFFSGFCSLCRTRIRASNRRVGACDSGAAIQSPRLTFARLRPCATMFRAQRCPAPPVSASSFWA